MREHYPEIVLRSGQVDVAAPNELLVHVQVTVRDHTSEVMVPVHLEIDGGELIATGEFPLRHADLGLTPFSVMMGAMQVQDEMKIRFRIHAACGQPQGSGSSLPAAAAACLPGAIEQCVRLRVEAARQLFATAECRARAGGRCARASAGR